MAMQRKNLQSIYKLKTNIINEINTHNHGNHKIQIEKIKLNKIIKEKAVQTTETSKSIVIREIMKMSDEQKISSMKKCIKRERMNDFGLKILSFIDIPEILQKDHHGKKFMLYDSGSSDENRVVVFCSEFKKKYIVNSKTWISDGTFRSTPVDFYQMLTIHFLFFGKTYPGFYILLRNKKEDSYLKAFNYIKSEFNCCPDNIIIDFEQGLYNAFKKKF